MLLIEIEFAFTNTLFEIHRIVETQINLFGHTMTSLELKRLKEVHANGLDWVIEQHNGLPQDILTPYGNKELAHIIAEYGSSSLIGSLNSALEFALTPKYFKQRFKFEMMMLFSMSVPKVASWERVVKVVDVWNRRALSVGLPYLDGCSFRPNFSNLRPKMIICGKAGTYDTLSKETFFTGNPEKLRLLQASWNHRHNSIKLSHEDLFQ